MSTRQGELALLNELIARQLLRSSATGRVTSSGVSGACRDVPTHVRWNGSELELDASPERLIPGGIREKAKVTLTIESSEYPCNVLLIRGSMRLAAGDRELAFKSSRQEAGERLLVTVTPPTSGTARVTVTPDRVRVLHFKPCA